MSMRQHIVRKGEFLASLAWRYGFDADEVWAHPKNQELVNAGRTPDLLCPGDLLWIPAVTAKQIDLEVGTANVVVAAVPTVTLRVKLVGDDGKPLANKTCTVSGLGEPATRETTAEGELELVVDVHLSQLEVLFEEPEQHFVFRIGFLDPIDTPSGVRQRLVNLGYCPGGSSSEPADDELDTKAIAAFQKSQGLAISGAPDQPTKDRLLELHGL